MKTADELLKDVKDTIAAIDAVKAGKVEEKKEEKVETKKEEEVKEEKKEEETKVEEAKETDRDHDQVELAF